MQVTELVESENFVIVGGGYAKRLAAAQKVWDKAKNKGKPISLRELARQTGMDRESLMKNIKR